MTKKILFLLLAAFFFLLNSALWSQSRLAHLNGVVLDASNGETLPGAHVALSPGTQGASTDRYGRFSINRITAGRFEVRVSFIGFETYRDSIALGKDETRHLKIALRPTLLKFSEVTVSAERDRLTKEVNLSREFLDARQLRTTSALAEPDLFRSLALLPGVAQANDFNSRFHVRGGQGNENHVLVEGMTIHNPYHGLGFFSTFDVDAIKSVEVHRSLFPPRYNERLSSVTNVILRDGNAQRFTGLGTISLVTSKLLLEGPVLKYQPTSGRKWTFMLSGRRTYADAVINYPLYFYDFYLKSVYDSGRRTRITLHGFHSLDRLSGANDPFPLPSVEFSDIRWNNRALGVQWQQFLSTGSLWTTQLSFSDFNSDARETIGWVTGQPEVFSQKNQVREVTFNSEWQGRLRNLGQLTVGYAFSDYDIEQALDQFLSSSFQQTFRGRWSRSDQHKAYLAIASEVGERWLYELGGTALYFPEHHTAAFAPRAGVKYLLDESWRMKAGWGRHHQFLTTLDNDDDPMILFDAWLPTPAQRPVARADHYALGIEWTQSSKFETDVEGYYHRYDHLTRYNQVQRPGEPFYLDGWGESYGMELRATYNIKTYYGFANYSLGWAMSHFFLRNQPMRFENDFRWQSFPSNSDARHVLNGVIGARPGGSKWDFSATFIYQSGRPYTALLGYTNNLVELPFQYYFFNPPSWVYFPAAFDFVYSAKNSRRYPSYQRVDFRAARHFNWVGADWTFFFQIYNLFFRRNAAFQFPDVEGFGNSQTKRPKALPIVPTFGVSFRF